MRDIRFLFKASISLSILFLFTTTLPAADAPENVRAEAREI